MASIPQLYVGSTFVPRGRPSLSCKHFIFNDPATTNITFLKVKTFYFYLSYVLSTDLTVNNKMRR